MAAIAKKGNSTMPSYIIMTDSALYGQDEHGPYASLLEVDKAIRRLRKSADSLGDNMPRTYTIIVNAEDEN